METFPDEVIKPIILPGQYAIPEQQSVCHAAIPLGQPEQIFDNPSQANMVNMVETRPMKVFRPSQHAVPHTNQVSPEQSGQNEGENSRNRIRANPTRILDAKFKKIFLAIGVSI